MAHHVYWNSSHFQIPLSYCNQVKYSKYSTSVVSFRRFHGTKPIIFENWNKKKIGIDNGFHLTFVYYPDPDVTWQKQLTVYEKPVVIEDSSTAFYITTVVRRTRREWTKNTGNKIIIIKSRNCCYMVDVSTAV